MLTKICGAIWRRDRLYLIRAIYAKFQWILFSNTEILRRNASKNGNEGIANGITFYKKNVILYTYCNPTHP